MIKNFRLTNSLLIISFFILVFISSVSLVSAFRIWNVKIKPMASVDGEFTTQAIGEVYNKNVAVVIYNPTMNDGQKLIANRGWSDPDTLVVQYISWLKVTTADKVNYTVVNRNEIDDFPTLADGRKYNPTTYLTCLNDSSTCYVDGNDYLMIMDYTTTINDLGVCSLFNSGTISEVWMFGGPYFGFYEANQAGVNAFHTNGPVVSGTSCNAPMSIMGYSYERGVSEMAEDLMHRTEGTLRTAYGSWDQNSNSHKWNTYSLVDYLSPDYAFSGCGNCHYAPNSIEDYDWANTASVSTYCDEFYDYPDPIDTSNRKTVTCSEWGCTSLGYFRWWMRHLPTQPGVAPDNMYADWWKYVLEPETVYDELIYVPITTVAPTTIAPTTITSTTVVPTTIVATTVVPTTVVPTTKIPTTGMPITLTPTIITTTPIEDYDPLAEWEDYVIVPRVTKQIEYEEFIKITETPIPTTITIESNPSTGNEVINTEEMPVATRVVLSLTMFGTSGVSFAIGIKALLKLFV